MSHILLPDRTCWKVAEAKRLSYLVDAQEYYAVVHRAMKSAKQRIIILCWDINSGTEMLHDGRAREEPTQLGPYLRWLVDRRDDLHVYILDWCYPYFYGLDREKNSKSKFQWGHCDRIHFRLDDQLPIGASHHEKVIVIDGELAFVGGMDITESRWDTPQHLPSDPRRRNMWGKDYPATHDVQVMVQGEAAAAFAALARERWRRATGQALEPCILRAPDPFDDLPWQFGPQPVGIARTCPSYYRYPRVDETQQLILRMIDRARTYVYIEQQYFTSQSIARALAASLSKPDGPEVIVIQPKSLREGFANKLLDALRFRRMKELRDADAYGRLRHCYPAQQGSDDGIFVHSKLMIVDDECAFVTSANFTDRSLGYDTESGIVACGRAQGDAQSPAAFLLRKLLAEHAGLNFEHVESALSRQPSIARFIDRLERRGRHLAPLELSSPGISSGLLWLLHLVDPVEPLAFDAMFDTVERTIVRRHPWRRILVAMLAGTLLGVFFFIWYVWSIAVEPAIQSLDAAHVLSRLQKVELYPLLAITGIVVGIVLFVPYNLLTIGTATLFPGTVALAYILCGGMLGTLLTYGLGRLIGAAFLRRALSRRIEQLGHHLQSGGYTALLLVRMVPVAPFALVNIVAGAFRVPLGPFLLSTFVVLLPGAVVLVVFQSTLLSALLSGSPVSIAGLVFLTACLGFAIMLYRKRLRPVWNRLLALRVLNGKRDASTMDAAAR